jgi:uncharacterized protein (TIGR02996 family)
VEDHGRKLLEAVLADPDDDGPRLALADWLMERDDPRGEFIAVQCRIAAVEAEVEDGADCDNPTCPACSELRPLRRRERELLVAQGPRWLPIPGDACESSNVNDVATLSVWAADSWGYEATFRRGFVDSVTLATVDWDGHAEAILAAQPVRHVTLTTWPEDERGWYEATTFADGRRRAWVNGLWKGVTFALPAPPGLFASIPRG